MHKVELLSNTKTYKKNFKLLIQHQFNLGEKLRLSRNDEFCWNRPKISRRVETERRGMGVQNPLQKHLPARFHGKGWWLVPAFFRVDEMASGRVPDIKIRFVSTAISEATSLIFFPACGCRGDFSFCGIALGLNYGCLLLMRQIVNVPSVLPSLVFSLSMPYSPERRLNVSIPTNRAHGVLARFCLNLDEIPM